MPRKELDYPKELCFLLFYISVDPILDGTEYDLSEYVYEVVNFTAYLYVRDNPLRWVDPLGLIIADRGISRIALYNDGGRISGLDSAAQSTPTKAPAAQPSTSRTGGVISGDKAALGKVPQANITPIDPDPQPSSPKDEIVPQTKEQQYGNIIPTLGTWPLLRTYGVLRPLVFDIMAELDWNIIRFNYAYNSTLPQITGYIYEQNEGDVTKYRYGAYFMSYNGCGVIANYNALVALENPQSLNDVANWCETHGSMLIGTFGTWPDSTRQLFESLGYKVKVVFNSAEFDTEARKADANVFTYWNTKGNPFDGVHTVYVDASSDGLEIYNLTGWGDTTHWKPSFTSWINEGIDPMVLYCIYK